MSRQSVSKELGGNVSMGKSNDIASAAEIEYTARSVSLGHVFFGSKEPQACYTI